MADTDRKYVRVYYNDLIRDYPEVWDDDAQLATWLRLLASADPMWPTPPELPRSVRPRALGRLVDAGLVSTLASHRFRMKGMDAERGRRQESARNAAAVRWQSDRSQRPNATAMPKRAETSKAEQEQCPPASNDPWDAPETEALAWLSRHGCDVRPGNGYHQKLVLAVERHGSTAVVGMMDRLASAGVRNGDIKGLLFGATDALDQQSRPSLSVIQKEERDDERSEGLARRVAATKVRIHENGGHELEPSPGCPRCPHPKSEVG